MSTAQPKTKAQERSEQLERLIRLDDEFSAKRAQKIMREWMEEEPFSANLHNYRGIFATKEGDIQRAIRHYENSCKYDPGFIFPWHNQGTAYLSLGNYEEAIECAEEVARLASGIVWLLRARRLKAFGLMELGRYDEAFSEASKIADEQFAEILIPILHIVENRVSEALDYLFALKGLATLGGAIVYHKEHPDSIKYALDPLLDFALSALQEGHSPEQLLDSLDLPPDDLAPGTPEYIDWWRQELHDPHWEGDTRLALELLSAPPAEHGEEGEEGNHSLTHMEFEGKRYVFEEPLEIQVQQSEGVWTHESKELGLMGYGTSFGESLVAMKIDLAYVWECIAKESDDKLTPGAITLKRKLLSSIRQVEEFA